MTPLSVELVNSRFPTIEAVRRGEGTINVELSAAIPALSAGRHRLFYRNSHRADIGVYLANALVPASDRIVVLAQRRAIDQRDLIADYKLREDSARAWYVVSIAGVVLALATLWRGSRVAE